MFEESSLKCHARRFYVMVSAVFDSFAMQSQGLPIHTVCLDVACRFLFLAL